MIKHIVMWKVENKDDALEMKIRLEGLKELIKEIVKLEVGINTLSEPRNFDVILISEFHNSEDLKSYADHPEHLKVVQFIKQVAKNRTAIDYEK